MKTNRNISDLVEPFQTKVRLWLNECKEKGIDIKVSETTRTKERQLYLVSKGLSKTMNSLHLKGKAVDIYFDIPGRIYLEKEPNGMSKWREVADIAQKYGIDWGYDLWSWDMPHFQDNGEPLKSTESFDTEKKEVHNKTNLKNTMEISGYIFAPKEIEDQMNFLIRKANDRQIQTYIGSPSPAVRFNEMVRIGGELKQRTSEEEYKQIAKATSDIKKFAEYQDAVFKESGKYSEYTTKEKSNV